MQFSRSQFLPFRCDKVFASFGFLRLLLICLSLLHVTTVYSQNVGSLLRSTKVVRGMTEQELIDLVPVQSGLQYIGCPNCQGGRQERQLEWTIKNPDAVTCRFCKHSYPSDKYPMDQVLVVDNPLGAETHFSYWANGEGYRYFFKARRDDEVRKYLARQTLKLAQLYSATGEQVHARRAVVILDRFAQVFPSWCYHYDYPFRQKEIYDGAVAPENFRAGFRTARWNWWAYHDIPRDLVEAYRLIRESSAVGELSKEAGVNVAERIRDDLLLNAGSQVISNRDNCTNMSPSVWRSLVKLARVIDEPRYVHEVVRRFRRLMNEKFFYDGFWYEGAPSYAFQTLSSLDSVLNELKGYSDPPGYLDPIDKTRFDNLDLNQDFPMLAKARAAVETMRFPNGRLVPVHDTWAYTRVGDSVESASSYLLPGLGHGCLVSGAGLERSEFHLSWSGGYGHEHLDLLSLIFFSHGRESLSDLGYTHTAYRPWAISTVAHNTVVIDGQSQARGALKKPNDGSLQIADFTRPGIQVLRADAVRAYADLASTYRRTMVVVEVDEQRRYAVDLFEVEGGTTHDYFLHGDADAPAQVTTEFELEPLETLLPENFEWVPTVNEGQGERAIEPHYPYGFLNNLNAAEIRDRAPINVDFQVADQEDHGLRVTLCPEPESQLVLGMNPSVRMAKEDDSQLTKHNRPFLMLRRRASGSRSVFASVLEPHGQQPFINLVERIELDGGAVALKVKIGHRTDTIVFNAEQQQTIHIEMENGTEARFQGTVGMLRVQSGKINSAYALGEGGWQVGDFRLVSTGQQRARLESTAPNTLVVSGEDLRLPNPGEVVRLTTEDGWTYPYNIVSASLENDQETIQLRTAEGPSMEYDAKKEQLRLTSYPQRKHQGMVYVEWQSASTWAKE